MEFVTQIRTKYPHLSVDDAKQISDRAKMFYFGLRYPCEPYADETTRPIKTFFAKQWILLACEELIERLGVGSAVTYKENGVSFDFGNAHLSDRLVGMITPIIGVI